MLFMTTQVGGVTICTMRENGISIFRNSIYDQKASDAKQRSGLGNKVLYLTIICIIVALFKEKIRS